MIDKLKLKYVSNIEVDSQRIFMMIESTQIKKTVGIIIDFVEDYYSTEDIDLYIAFITPSYKDLVGNYSNSYTIENDLCILFERYNMDML